MEMEIGMVDEKVFRTSAIYKKLVRKHENAHIQIIPTRFKFDEKIGDFGKVLADPKSRKNMVAMFNDNTYISNGLVCIRV